MDLELSSEQVLFAEGLERLLAPFRDVPANADAPYLISAELETALLGSGYLDVCRYEGMGQTEAVLLIEAVARLPYACEIASTALIAPSLGLDSLPRPLAIIGDCSDHPVRFLENGGAALLMRGADVHFADRVENVEALSGSFAYPLARPLGLTGIRLPGVRAASLRHLQRVALCAEAIGAMAAALDLTVGYVRDRRQFGRPIGAFQAVQHRLAECACLLNGARLLTFKAANGSAVDAALAGGFVQGAMRQLIFETTQLHGAMGLSLEYPLHLWTYRLRVLQGELGGAGEQYTAAAQGLWGASGFGSDDILAREAKHVEAMG